MEYESGWSCNLSFLGSCKCKKQLFVISIFSGCSLLDIFERLGKKCAEFTPEAMILQYVAPQHKMNVTLNNDDDVLNMIHLHMCMKLSMIELRAESKNEHVRNQIFGVYIILVRVDEEDRQRNSGNEADQASLSNTLDAWINCIHGVGQTFKDAAEFRRCVKNYAVSTRRSFSYRKNDSEKVTVTCTDTSCGWRIYASKYKADNIFAIRKCNLEHTCGENNLRSRGHPRADATWIANVVKGKLIGEPSYRPCTIQKDLQRDYGVELNYRNVWKGKELAMHDIHGTDKGCYDRLRWYCRAVKETNPGSVAECEIDIETNKFKRLFICLHACVVGFVTGCRPLIFLDGTHIKNKFKVCILLAVSKDANDDLFTIAYSVVDAENDINWEWFCYHLRSVLLSCQSIPFNEYTFFSDRHPGIIKAVNLLFTGSHHAYCLRHLVDNFVKVEHEQHIKNILESMPLARDFIVNSEPQSWANALFLGNRWGVINNNIAEC
ncbi:uncharacterized protein LOC142505302 [Primulina tabacum]|uniref:uncharacterized protein LOC142505302 n=1 Tax=Primulina tabacum TaxID=48773 RepID=UPI003F5A48A2